MASWTNHQAKIYEYGSGGLPGSLVGTITNILDKSASGSSALSEAGQGSFKIHGADTPSVSLCQEFRIAVVTADSSVSGKTHEICAFIIRSIEPSVVGKHVIYTISGPDLIGSIKWGGIDFNVISDGAGGESSTPISDLLDNYTNKVWSVVEHGTAPNGALAVGSGETSFVVLINLLLQMNAQFSFALKGNPKFELHIWYGHTETAPTGFDALALLETDNPAAYQEDPNTAVITQPIKVIKEEQEIYTRAYVYGAGMGPDRWTMAELDFGPFTYLVPGFTWNAAQSTIVNWQLETEMPEIKAHKQFAHLEPSDPSDPDSVAANAKAIFFSGLTWLRHRADSVIVYYEVPDLIIHADILPGQLIHVSYNRASPVNAAGGMVTTNIINLNQDLIVLGIQHRLGEGGVRYTSLLLGESVKRPSTGLNMMAERLKELEDTVRHTSAGSGGGGAPSGGGDSSSYLWASGSGPVLTGDLLVDPLFTIDGVDISAHVEEADAHHSPGTLSADSPNGFSLGVEYHAIANSSNPGANRTILSTDAGGKVVLVRGDFTNLVLTDRDNDQKYNIYIEGGKMFIEAVS